MNTSLLANASTPILSVDSDVVAIGDALAIVAAAFEHDAAKILLREERLPASFFELRTGFAGEFIQKLVNYRFIVGAVFARPESMYSTRFIEYIGEARRGRQFRTFRNETDAISWLDSA